MQMTTPHRSDGGDLKIQVLVEARIVLELILNRGGFVENAERLLMEIEHSQQLEVYVTECCLDQVHLYVRILENIESAEAFIFKLREKLNDRIIPIERGALELARTLPLNDFNTALEVASAITNGLGAMIVQEPDNFRGINLQILGVNELIKCLNLEQIYGKHFSPVVPIGESLSIQHLLHHQSIEDIPEHHAGDLDQDIGQQQLESIRTSTSVTQKLSPGRGKRPKLNNETVAMRMSPVTRQALEEIAYSYDCIYGGKPWIAGLLEKIGNGTLRVITTPTGTITTEKINSKQAMRNHFRLKYSPKQVKKPQDPLTEA